MTEHRDIRAILQYIPQFIGATFVLEIHWNQLSATTQAELVLDIRALQTTGVHLAILLPPAAEESFLENAVEQELKLARPSLSLKKTTQTQQILTRGQAALILQEKEQNISKETAEFAQKIGAKKLISISLQEHISSSQPLGAIALSEAEKINSAPSEEIQRAIDACRLGIHRVHLLNGDRPGVLLDELFSSEGVGTMVHADVYQEIRPLKEEDIPELLGMIGRSVRNSHLVPRNYDQIAAQINDYYVICLDDHVIGSIALHLYPEEQVGEIACLYVKQSHQSRGYASQLIAHVEYIAKQRKLHSLFALTTKAAKLFEQLNYSNSEFLPQQRQQQLIASKRKSQIWRKPLI